MKLAAALLLLALAPACGPTSSDDDDDSCSTFLAGDLVLTEIMANPDGDDTGNEWFEIYNATGQAQSLVGLRLIASREDGTSEEAHLIAAGEIAAGQYLVAGGVLDDIKPAHVDYGYGGDLGALLNGAGRIALGCGATTVDEALYEEMEDGVARGLTGAVAPDYTANDDLTNWCDATAEYLPESFGSPGAANQSCGGGPTGTCNDGGTPRDTVPPEPGDLVITELLPNPEKVDDAKGEWFELYAAGDVDLNGLEIGTVAGEVKSTLDSGDCLRVEAGSYVVLAREPDTTMNGMLPPALAEFDFGLTNSASSLFVGLGGQVLDQVSWPSSRAGKSLGLDPRRLTPADNDDPESWCDATAPYGAGDLGSPAAENPQCELPLPEGMCEDGDTVREAVLPGEGDLVITEYMADPDAKPDTTAEWFEVRVTAAVDLVGLEIGTVNMGVTTVELSLSASDCLHADAGDLLIFARTTNMTDNGGLPAVDHLFDFNMVNSDRGFFIGRAGAVLAQVNYTTTTAGVAASLDPDEDRFCPAVDVYGAGDRGTPGAANPQCPAP